MKTGKYDEEEKALILQVGDNYPHNLREGFRIVAAQLDRSVDNIASRYYYLKKKEQEKGNYSLMLFSKKKAILDRKIIRKGCPIQPQQTYPNLWERILKLLSIK